MKSVIGVATTSTAAVAAAEPSEPAVAVTRDAGEEERAEEAFEATILKLDGAAIEWLLRQAGE